MHSFAQTNLQLLKQLSCNGYSESDLITIVAAYQLAMKLFTGHFRGDGKTFMAHLVGTASILASVNAPCEVVAAGLLHAAYAQGDFGDGKKGISEGKRDQIKQTVGREIEKYIAKYTLLEWNEESIVTISTHVHTLTSDDRHVLVMRLANELEDHLDLGILYCANVRKRLQYVAQSQGLMTSLAETLGFPGLAAELKHVFTEVTSTTISPKLRTTSDYSFQLAPQSYQKRVPVMIHDYFIRSKRLLSSAIKRLAKFKSS